MHRAPLLLTLLLPRPASAEEPTLLAYASGLKVALFPVEGASRVALGAQIAAGEGDNPADSPELAHLVEHLWFSNTDTSGASVWDTLDALGCDANGVTHEHRTEFLTTCPSSALDAVLALEARRLREPLAGIDTSDLLHARRTVANERDDRQQSGVFAVQDLVFRALYPDFRPARAPAVEPADDALLATANAFAQRHYTATHSALVVAGGFRTAALRPKLEAAFGAEAPVPPPPPRAAPPKARPTLRVAPRTLKAPVAHPMLVLAWDVSPIMDKALLNAMLEHLLNAALYQTYRRDARAVGWGCDRVPSPKGEALLCAVSLDDDAPAMEMALALRGVTDGLWSGPMRKFLKESLRAARSQAVLSLHGLLDDLEPVPGGAASTLSQALLWTGSLPNLPAWEEEIPSATVADVLDLGSAALDPGQALVVVVEPGPKPIVADATPTPSPPPRPGLAPMAIPTGEALATQRVVLENGLTVLAIPRPDLRLVYGTASVELSDSLAASSVAAFDVGSSGPRPTWLWQDVLGDEQTSPLGLEISAAAEPEQLSKLLAELSANLREREMDLPALGVGMRLKEVAHARAQEEAAWWSDALTRAAMGLPTSLANALLGMDLVELRAAQLSDLAAAVSAPDPRQTVVVLVGPLSPESLISAAKAAFSGWSGAAVAPGNSEEAQHIRSPPRRALIPVEGTRSAVALRCPLPDDLPTDWVLRELVARVAFDTLREQAGLVYTPSVRLHTRGPHPVLAVSADSSPGGGALVLDLMDRALASLAESLSPNALALARQRVLLASTGRIAPWDQMALAQTMEVPEALSALPAQLAAVDAAGVSGALRVCQADAIAVVAGPREPEAASAQSRGLTLSELSQEEAQALLKTLLFNDAP